ncbi:MAG: Rab family GTPase [Promethearchaeota archaeon]
MDHYNIVVSVVSGKATWKFKVVLFGPGGVGKTSLIIRFVRKHFSDEVKKTIGTNFLVKDVDVESELVRLLVWDIAGQDQFWRMHKFFFNAANAGLAVFDLARATTFEEMPRWFASLRENVGGDLPVYLVGNKVDLPRRVSREEAAALADREGVRYVETSAKEGTGVEEAFLSLARSCIEIALEHGAGAPREGSRG